MEISNMSTGIWTDHDHNNLKILSVMTPKYRTWTEDVKAAISRAILAGPKTGNVQYGDMVKVPFATPLKALSMSDPIPPTLGVSTGMGIATFRHKIGDGFVLVEVEMPYGYDPTC